MLRVGYFGVAVYAVQRGAWPDRHASAGKNDTQSSFGREPEDGILANIDCVVTAILELQHADRQNNPGLVVSTSVALESTAGSPWLSLHAAKDITSTATPCSHASKARRWRERRPSSRAWISMPTLHRPRPIVIQLALSIQVPVPALGPFANSWPMDAYRTIFGKPACLSHSHPAVFSAGRDADGHWMQKIETSASTEARRIRR